MSIFEIPSDISDSIREGFDDVFAAWSKECKLYYPPKLIPCNNCVNGHWRTGGPMKFTFGVCPVCQSKGVRTQDVTENIDMILYLQPAQWVYPLDKFNINIREPGGLIQSKAFLYNFPKIKKCDYMQIINVDGYSHFNYKLLGEPLDIHNMVQARYCVMVWQRT